MSEHRLMVGASLHVPGYVQSADPGFVGPNKLWVDTSGGTGTWTLKLRNDADSAWELLNNVMVAPLVTTFKIWNPDSGAYQEYACRNNPDGDPELYPV